MLSFELCTERLSLHTLVLKSQGDFAFTSGNGVCFHCLEFRSQEEWLSPSLLLPGSKYFRLFSAGIYHPLLPSLVCSSVDSNSPEASGATHDFPLLVWQCRSLGGWCRFQDAGQAGKKKKKSRKSSWNILSIFVRSDTLRNPRVLLRDNLQLGWVSSTSFLPVSSK